MFNGNGDLDAVTEDRPATVESDKRMKEEYNPAPARDVRSPTSAPARNLHSSAVSEDEHDPTPVVHSPAPLLPEIGGLGNGTTSGGDLGWDEGMFKR